MSYSESPLEQAWLEFGTELYGDYLPIPSSHKGVKVKCALHMESRPSAVVNLETGKWRCYAGCGHGDVYDLIGAHEGLVDFRDQKRYADDKGWLREDPTLPEPSPMNPNPKPRTVKKGKKPWKPAWL